MINRPELIRWFWLNSDKPKKDEMSDTDSTTEDNHAGENGLTLKEKEEKQAN